MKQSEVTQLSTAELQEKLSETKKSYADLKMAHTVSPLENPIQLIFTKNFIIFKSQSLRPTIPQEY